MKKYYCNPINISCRYQFVPKNDGSETAVFREAADPSLVLFNGKYLLFPSMSVGFYYSDDLVNWDYQPLDYDRLPLYDYAPDVRVIGEYLYFCASHRDTPCDFFRTKDPFSGKFEKIEGAFDFWDPNLFEDIDGKVYFYWGCSNVTPIWGAEMDKETMRIKGEPVPLIYGNKEEHGYERMGRDHKGEDNGVLSMLKKQVAEHSGINENDVTKQMIMDFLPEKHRKQVAAAIENAPYIEGAWMTKHKEKYYLQYAVPDTQENIYGDGVYVSDNPLGPFVPAENNPFSYRPSGFAPGAGHGSTMADKHGNYLHVSTITVSVNHSFERRVGLWKCGFDEDGELFCNQRFADWVTEVSEERDSDIWKEPELMLLSYGKKVKASSGNAPENAADENIATWWRAEGSEPGEWLEIDLGNIYDVDAVQVNFADEVHGAALPEGKEYRTVNHESRYIDTEIYRTRWILEYSEDGKNYFTLKDNGKAETDLSHELAVPEESVKARFVKLTVIEVPYGQNPCVSGLRVFGKGNGALPEKPEITKLSRTSDLDFYAEWSGNAVGYNLLWGKVPR